MLITSISAARLKLLDQGPIVVLGQPAQFSVTGPGAVQCVQGVLTNDIVKPGPHSAVYGALLTPKGMVIADAWVLRGAAEEALLLIADRLIEDRLADLFRRQFPPRVARVTNLTPTEAVVWILGTGGPGFVTDRFGDCPKPGGATTARIGDQTVRVARPESPRAPFSVMIAGSAAGCRAAAGELASGGATIGTADDLTAVRAVKGFPALGIEIDDRTMPAEIDYGGIAGVSHSKGCYVGQETVARLHFRGHANWLLRRIRSIDGSGIPETGEIIEAEKVVARLGTILKLDDGSWFGSAKVRREVEPGTTIGGGLIESFGPN